jgi:hypothetical protein
METPDRWSTHLHIGDGEVRSVERPPVLGVGTHNSAHLLGAGTAGYSAAAPPPCHTVLRRGQACTSSNMLSKAALASGKLVAAAAAAMAATGIAATPEAITAAVLPGMLSGNA